MRGSFWERGERRFGKRGNSVSIQSFLPENNPCRMGKTPPKKKLVVMLMAYIIEK
jgi:hypothetical protein